MKHLETELAEKAAVVAALVAARCAMAVDEEGIAKLKWQADYLEAASKAWKRSWPRRPRRWLPLPLLRRRQKMRAKSLRRLRWRNRFLKGGLPISGGRHGRSCRRSAPPSAAAAMLTNSKSPTRLLI
ncbi:MAG: hypothetical protein R3C04_00435 [Hyphomonas sp.]